MNGVWRRAALPLGARAIALAAMIVPFASLAHAAAITVSWTAPTTNANGTKLTDLAGYRIYLATSSPACPGSGYHAVSSTTASPGSGQTVSSRIASLTASTTYFVRVTAVDTSGSESSCSGVASGVAHADISVTPTTTVAFGSIAPNTTVDRTFTVTNTSTASLSGTVSVGAPFSIVSGGSFSLAPNATQNVVVRFRPTSSGSFSSNVNFTTNGDTTSRAVNGTGTGSTPSPPASGGSGTLDVFITSPASGATVATNGTAVVWVEGNKGTSNTFTLSVDGSVESTQTSASRGPITLPWTSIAGGTHTVTATVRDSTGQTGSTSVSIKVPGGSTTPPPSSPPPSSPPPSSPPPSGSSLSLSMTEPDPGETVHGVVWVILWANGAQGTKTFGIAVNGQVVGSVTTTNDGPVAIPWTTSSVSNGAHTLLAGVRDGTGRIATTSVSVTTRN